jgi:spore coat protein CotH
MNSYPQEFLQKISVKSKKKTEFLQPLQNHVPVNKFLRKMQEKKILRNPVRNGFLDPKNKFLKTGIGNLA